MAKIRLELAGRPGSYFEAEVKAAELHVSFGPRGRNMPTKARPFPSEIAARAELERLLGLHRSKGYVDAVEAPAKPAGPTPQQLIAEARAKAEWLAARQAQAGQRSRWKLVVDEALLAACEASPGDPAPWHVYADRLAAGDDPRGELALGLQRGLAWEAGKALPEFLGPAVPLEVSHGFVRAVALGGQELEVLARFLATPFAASLRMLRVGLPPSGDWSSAIEVISEAAAGRRLRELELDASDRLVRDPAAYAAALAAGAPDQDAYDGLAEYQRASRLRVDHVDRELRDRLAEVCPVRISSAAWGRLTGLERLVIDGPCRGDLGSLALPALRELVLRSDRLAHVRDLAAAVCPRLETLELWFGDQVWSGARGELDVVPLLEPGVLPSLQTLRVFDADDATLALVRASKLAKRVVLETTPPEGSRAARYAHPQTDARRPMKLPRDGEPPKPKPKPKPKKS